MKSSVVETKVGEATLVAVVNWNGWADTLECIQSLRQLSDQTIDLVVCDNGSSDESLAVLSRWLITEFGVSTGLNLYEQTGMTVSGFLTSAHPGLRAVYLLSLSSNAGYAGALNQCIIWGRRALGSRQFWLLNNDVKVDPHALTYLVRACERDSRIGICGSVLVDWGSPDSIQAIGGRFSRAFAVGSHIKKLPKGETGTLGVFYGIDYPVGASLFVRDDYIQAVGLMDPDYFLYYEEIDWVERGRRRGFRPAVALESRVQHKEGASTGSHGGVRKLSILSERFGVINRLRITGKLWPRRLPVVWASLWIVMFERLTHGEFARAIFVLRLMFQPRLWAIRKSHDQT